MDSNSLATRSAGFPSRQPLQPRDKLLHAISATQQSGRTEDDLDLSKIRVVSAEGELAANSEQRKLLCLTADGRLFVAEGKRTDHHVMSYQALLQRRTRQFKVLEVPLATIMRLYSVASSSGRTSDTSKMMEECKEIIAKAAEHRCSDVHIRVGQVTKILYRIHGDLVEVRQEDELFGMKILRTFYQAMADISEETFKANGRCDARIGDRDKLPDGIHGIRISTTPTDEGNLMVLRLLYNDTVTSIDVRDLGFTQEHYELMRLLNEQPIGMNIICGPTGSGKSTTLQRVLRWQIVECNGRRHVITVEDPPEMPIEGAVQTPVTGGDSEEVRSSLYSEAIANAMRLDPDTIMVGEMRDPPSARMALRAAMTGHQVWTTLHANSAMAIIDRLSDLGLPLELLTDHTLLTGLMAQRLVKVLCPACKRRLQDHTDLIKPALFERVKRALGADWANVYICGPGCDECKNTGYVGRTCVCEIIIPDPTFMYHIRNGDKIAARKHWLDQQRGKTYLSHALEKIKDGYVDPANAERVVGRLNMDELLSDASLTMKELADVGRE